jgi:hypothetical protein
MSRVASAKLASELIPVHVSNTVQELDISYGYYGLKGGIATSNILFQMFPDVTKHQAFPQNIGNFIEAVLVPEAITLLIAQDHDIAIPEDINSAYKILKESREFGNAFNLL